MTWPLPGVVEDVQLRLRGAVRMALNMLDGHPGRYNAEVILGDLAEASTRALLQLRAGRIDPPTVGELIDYLDGFARAQPVVLHLEDVADPGAELVPGHTPVFLDLALEEVPQYRPAHPKETP